MHIYQNCQRVNEAACLHYLHERFLTKLSSREQK